MLRRVTWTQDVSTPPRSGSAQLRASARPSAPSGTEHGPSASVQGAPQVLESRIRLCWDWLGEPLSSAAKRASRTKQANALGLCNFTRVEFFREISASLPFLLPNLFLTTSCHADKLRRVVDDRAGSPPLSVSSEGRASMALSLLVCKKSHPSFLSA